MARLVARKTASSRVIASASTMDASIAFSLCELLRAALIIDRI